MIKEVDGKIIETHRWCYGCNEVKPLDHEHWGWGNKAHTRFRTKCRKCTNYDSMISHRIHKKVKQMNDTEMKKIRLSTLYGIREKDLRYIGIIEVLDSLVERIVCTKSVYDVKTYVELFEEVYLLYLKDKENKQ